MDRDKQYSEHSSEANWTEEQEKAYWHEVNKSFDARQVIAYITGLSSMDIVDTVATAKGYKGSDIFKDCTMPALEYEAATNAFLREVSKITAEKLQTKKQSQ